MEISSTVFSDVLSPLAIFSSSSPPTSTPQERYQAGEKSVESRQLEWEESPLNHKNRVDGLDSLPPNATTWRLDGADTDGRRFFAVPHFALDKPPGRIDVYVPPFEEYPRALRDVLKPESVLWSSSKGRMISDLPIARYLLRALNHWSAAKIGPAFEREYLSMPFGSQIFVTRIAASFEDADIHLFPDYQVEQSMLSFEALQKMWGFEKEGTKWPAVIELSDLRFKRQLHEAITLVTVEGENEGLMVFKSLLRDQRYMYNELKMLLSLKPHPNLVPKPKYVVVKKGKFGGRRGVCGFVMEYFPSGSLKERLLPSGKKRKLGLEEKFRLAKQVTEVLIHVNAHENGFYPDLKPDNIVLKESSEGQEKTDAVLLDLEQRGGWFSWSPPEVGYVEYLEIIAANAPEGYKKEKAWKLLRGYIPDWKVTGQKTRYYNSDGGFSAPWLALLKDRQEKGSEALEKAQVFMLGKLLWCIFEGEARVRCGIDHEVLQENGGGETRGFPEFREAPEGMRELIEKCTAGAVQWDAKNAEGVVLQGGRLHPAGATQAGGAAVAEDTARAAKEFWLKETERAEAFVEKFLACQSDRDHNGVVPMRSRPLLVEVLAELRRIEKVVLNL